MKFSNPTLFLSIPDYPSGSLRVECKFYVENRANKGSRVCRQTRDKNGKWCKPKQDTYADRVAIVTGEDGKTYLLSYTPHYGMVGINRHDFKNAEANGATFQSNNPERYAELVALIEEANQGKDHTQSWTTDN